MFGRLAKRERPAPASTACPYLCGHVFDRPPRRGRKCPTCGRQFWVRQGVPLTDEGTRHHDAAVTLVGTATDHGKIGLRIRAKDPKAVARDMYWATLSEKLLGALRRSDWASVSRVLEAQVDELVERGKPYLAVAREASKAELRKLTDAGVTDVRIIAYPSHGGLCRACVPDRDRVLSIENEIVSPSLPHEACVNAATGPCRCWYAAIV